MQASVPQFIDVEDRIIGPLTLKQFLYLAGGGGIIFALWFFVKLSVLIMLAIPIGTLSLALAFYQINGRPFIFFLTGLFSFAFKPQLYLWQRMPEKVKMGGIGVAKKVKASPQKQVSGKKLEDLAQSLDIGEKIDTKDQKD